MPIGVTTAAALVIFGGGLTAVADTSTATDTVLGQVDEQASAYELVESLPIDEAAAEELSGLIQEPAETHDAMAATSTGLVVLPEDGAPELALFESETEESLVVTLPDAGPIVSTDTAAVVASADEGDQDAFLVQATDLGAQIINIATTPTEEHEFTIATETPAGAAWQATESGSLELRSSEGALLAAMDVPWAIDANGEALPTSFVIADGTITQHVDTAGAAFPVVSDPSLWWVIGTVALCAAEIASLAVGAAKVISAFAKADKIVKSTKAVLSAYKALGNSMSKVFNHLKKYIKNKNSLTRTQRIALEDFISKVGKAVFNLLGLGSCLSLATGR